MCDHIIWPVFTPDTQKHSGPTVSKQHPTSQCILTLVRFFSHSHVFCLSISHHDTQTPRLLCCSVVMKWIHVAQRWSDTMLPFPHYCPLSPAQKLEVTEQGRGCRHGIWKYEQRGGAEPEGVWAVRAETQHSAAAEGLHCPAVHF